jgi:hypothetical protein
MREAATLFFKESIMRKTTIKALAPAFALLCLLALSACPPDADTEIPGEKTGRIIIKNIPAKVKAGGPDSFKIYVQLSESMNETDPPAAIGSGKIADKQPNGDVVLDLYREVELEHPTEVKGSYYIAITICPQNAPSSADIQVRVPSTSTKDFSSELNILDWDTSIDLNSLSGLGEPRIKAIYDLIIKKDAEIETPQ